MFAFALSKQTRNAEGTDLNSWHPLIGERGAGSSFKIISLQSMTSTSELKLIIVKCQVNHNRFKIQKLCAKTWKNTIHLVWY